MEDAREKAGTPNLASYSSDPPLRSRSCTTTYLSGIGLRGARRNSHGRVGYRMMKRRMIEDKRVNPSPQIVAEKGGVNRSPLIAIEREGVIRSLQPQIAQERVHPRIPAACRRDVTKRPVCVLVVNETLTEVSLTSG
jgi:hypothetical protein